MRAKGKERRPLALSASLLGVVLWTAGVTAAADSIDLPAVTPATVLLIRPPITSEHMWRAAEKALCEELALLHISVETRDTDAEETDASNRDEMLQRSALDTGARIAVLISLLPGDPLRVEICLYDRAEESTAVKTWSLSDPEAPDAATIASIRAAEAIRAALRTNAENTDTNVSATAVSTPVAADTVQNPPPQPAAGTLERPSGPAVNSNSKRARLGRFGLGAGGCFAASFDNSGVREGVLLTLDWRPLRAFGVVLDAMYLPWGKDVSAGGVVSALDLVLFRAQAVWRARDLGRLRPRLGFGGGGLMVFAEGIEGDGQPLQKDLTKVGYLGGSAALGILTVEWLRLEIDAGIGATLRAVTLYHGEARAARIGRPLLDLSLRVAFGVF